MLQLGIGLQWVKNRQIWHEGRRGCNEPSRGGLCNSMMDAHLGAIMHSREIWTMIPNIPKSLDGKLETMVLNSPRSLRGKLGPWYSTVQDPFMGNLDHDTLYTKIPWWETWTVMLNTAKLPDGKPWPWYSMHQNLLMKCKQLVKCTTVEFDLIISWFELNRKDLI